MILYAKSGLPRMVILGRATKKRERRKKSSAFTHTIERGKERKKIIEAQH